MRHATALSIALLVLASAGASADDLEHGHQLASRWCAACHAIGGEPSRFRRAQPFAAIATKPGVTREMLVKFLLLPHATMANNPLSAADAADLADYILSLGQ
ncbi:Putative cytochrome c [Bradyrhizobium sp. ORS 278]|uniref:cytochrome c n=1 Tax=Bradyrhizobium sp. (strain ORS 278) TaxID=114615 RepID=UPI0001508B2F|nr:cytochrome c [Bradyrhizobium sp. ORS 278]CAL80465.1 Putative cytochrome c [Bradyrhizobium sp. ORS 278]